MASETWGSRPSHFMIIPNTKRHPNNTKTDQLPVLKVIAGLPRPYLHTTMSSAFGGKNISNEASTRLACKQADATDALLEEHRQEAQIPEPVGTLGVAALLRVALCPRAKLAPHRHVRHFRRGQGQNGHRRQPPQNSQMKRSLHNGTSSPDRLSRLCEIEK